MFATKKQLDLIHQMEKALDIKFEGLFIGEAYEFIKQNLQEFNEIQKYYNYDLWHSVNTLDNHL